MPRQCGLYLITPPTIPDLSAFAQRLSEALAGDAVAALQVRLKDVDDDAIAAAIETLGPLARAHDVALILNDRPDLAARLNCDGVHIGQDDGPIEEARRLVGSGSIIGVTCHASRHLAMVAAEAGADYVAFGAFFASHTKAAATQADLELLTVWQETMLTPCVAIGGIDVTNCSAVAAAGADLVAVSAGVWSHPDGPSAAIKAFRRSIAEGLAKAR